MHEAQWTAKMIEERMAEAADALRRLPSGRVQGYFNTWPTIIRDYWEAFGLHEQSCARSRHRRERSTACKRPSAGSAGSSAALPAGHDRRRCVLTVARTEARRYSRRKITLETLLIRTISCPYFQRAFAWSVPIGGMAGLIGLGGGEFRLPVLTRVIGYGMRTAIPLNLLVSLTTLLFALVVRNQAVSTVGTLGDHLPELIGLAAGGVASAAAGAALVARFSNRGLEYSTAILLAGLGLLLLVEAFASFGSAPLALAPETLRLAIGLVLGLGIGVVSSMLGVAGGELLIPALVLLFGLDIKVAGTASLMIALCIVSMGVWRYQRAGMLPLGGGPRRIIAAMSTGSLVGAALGGMAPMMARGFLPPPPPPPPSALTRTKSRALAFGRTRAHQGRGTSSSSTKTCR